MDDTTAKEILKELREMKELLEDFTSSGLPVRAQVPTSELMASCAVIAGLIARESSSPTETQLRQILQAAQVIGAEAIRQSDQFNSATVAAKLEGLR